MILTMNNEQQQEEEEEERTPSDDDVHTTTDWMMDDATTGCPPAFPTQTGMFANETTVHHRMRMMRVVVAGWHHIFIVFLAVTPLLL